MGKGVNRLLVNFYISDDTIAYSFHSNDIAGVIAASKESNQVAFENEMFYHFDYMIFNHYKDENGQMQQELNIYFVN